MGYENRNGNSQRERHTYVRPAYVLDLLDKGRREADGSWSWPVQDASGVRFFLVKEGDPRWLAKLERGMSLVVESGPTVPKTINGDHVLVLGPGSIRRESNPGLSELWSGPDQQQQGPAPRQSGPAGFESRLNELMKQLAQLQADMQAGPRDEEIPF